MAGQGTGWLVGRLPLCLVPQIQMEEMFEVCCLYHQGGMSPSTHQFLLLDAT